MTSYDLTLAREGDISLEQKYGWTGSHGTGAHTYIIIDIGALDQPVSILPIATDIWGLSAFVKASKQSVPSKVCTYVYEVVDVPPSVCYLTVTFY